HVEPAQAARARGPLAQAAQRRGADGPRRAADRAPVVAVLGLTARAESAARRRLGGLVAAPREAEPRPGRRFGFGIEDDRPQGEELEARLDGVDDVAGAAPRGPGIARGPLGAPQQAEPEAVRGEEGGDAGGEPGAIVGL